MAHSLGIDIGGTFTDLVVYDHDTGRQINRKVLTTHDDPARAVAAGVAALRAEGHLDPARVTRVVHATTLFTNALIEGASGSSSCTTSTLPSPSPSSPGIVVWKSRSGRRRTAG